MDKPTDPQWEHTQWIERVLDAVSGAGRPRTPVLNDWAQFAESAATFESIIHVSTPFATPASSEQISEIRNQLVTREAKSALDECISLLTDIREEIRHGMRVQSTIYSIGVAGELLLRTPISILIEEDEEGVLATAPEFEVVGDGPTEPDAIADLKIQLGELHDELISEPDEELGPLPLTWKRILLHLTKCDDSQI